MLEVEEAPLCERCSAIDFGYIRAPTAGQLRRLAAGDDVIGPFPFRRDAAEPEWQLGTIGTVRNSSKTCPLCRALVELVDETINRDRPDPLTPELLCSVQVEPYSAEFVPNEGALVSPRVLEHTGEQPLFRLRHLGVRFRRPEGERRHDGPEESAYDFILPYDPSSSCGSQGLFDDETLPDGRLVLCGRRSQPRVPVGLLSSWIGECTSRHGQCVAHSRPERGYSSCSPSSKHESWYSFAS